MGEPDMKMLRLEEMYEQPSYLIQRAHQTASAGLLLGHKGCGSYRPAVLGINRDPRDLAVRRCVGYMSQAFALHVGASAAIGQPPPPF